MLTFPVFENKDKTRTAKILIVILGSIVLLVSGLMLVWLLKGHPDELGAYAYKANILIIVFSLGLLFVIYRGYVQTAGILLVLFIWANITFQAFTSDGVRGSAAIIYLTIMILSSLLIGWRASIGVALSSIAVIWMLAQAEAKGSMQFQLDSPFEVALETTVIFAFAAILLILTTSGLRSALMRARKSERSLRESNRSLKDSLHELELGKNALRVSEEKYKTLFDHAGDGIFIAQDQHLKFPNPSMLKVLGYTKAEFERSRVSDIIHPDDQNDVLEKNKTALTNATGTIVPYEIKMVTKKGASILTEVNTIGVMWDGNPASLSFVRDISRQKYMEEQLQQAQKLEAIGTLAGGVAHDFNNLLMGILGNTSLMLANIDTAHPHREQLEAVEEYVKGGKNLTKQLLGIARGGKYEPKAVDINEIVASSAAMFSRTTKEIGIHINIRDESLVINGDRGQIEQVLLNLYINAWQAMPDGGEIYIETELVALDEAFCETHQIPAGRYIHVSVTDTGTGISAEVLPRVFDPFFTTKEKSRGTGLGLASAYGIIKNHSGIITVHSQKGKGAKFKIYLPESAQSVIDAPLPNEGLIQGSETLLLVDDEEMIVEVGRAMLERLGYRVIVAQGGEQAIEQVSQRGAEIALVILDMIMPGMDGGKTFERIREICPDMPVMLSSGYSIDGQAAEIMLKGCNGFIQKPFNISEISSRIRGLLDANAS